MKDLKHLYYFEQLLEDANNELVRKAKKEGDLCLGYTCFHMPEVLLNLGNCFSVRLRAPHTGSTEIASYYMSNGSCEYTRSILERAVEGNYHFLDAMMGVDLCEAMNRCMETMELLKINNPKQDKFFWVNTDVAYNDDEKSVKHTTEQLTRKVVEQLNEVYGVDTSAASIRKTVEEHNEICRLITEIGNYRKLDNPPITGYEFAVITLVTYVCPKRLILPYIRETAEELKTRQPDANKNYRIRVVVAGSEIDDPNLIKLFEESGALVVADRYCYGSFPGRQEIVLNDDDSADSLIRQICQQYLSWTECPRHCALQRVQHRYDFVQKLYEDYHADGIIYEQMKFCTYWSYERTLASFVMNNERGIPTLSIDRPYIAGNSGQLRTRVQAFVERIEMKNINEREEQRKKGAK